MAKKQLIIAVKKAIAGAETEKALQQLIAFLESNRTYRPMAKVARLAQAKQERAEKNLNLGFANQEDTDLIYNSVNRTLLQLVEDLEKEDFDISHYETDMRSDKGQRGILRILLGILVLLAGGLGYWVYSNFDGAKFTCPTFKNDSEFNVLLVPFQPNTTNELAPHVTIKRRLTNKSTKQRLKTCIEIDKDYFEKHDTPGKEEAMEVGAFCGAKMVIWGIWESTATGKLVSTNFKYLGNRDRFEFQKLKLESGDRIDTVLTMSNIETEGKLTEDIEKVIDNYFGLIAGLSGQPQAAIEALKNAVPMASDTSAFLLNQMTLANSYVKVGNKQAATQVYDKILEAHPNYGFARNNRGVLLYNKGEYEAAVADLNVKLAQTPDDEDALYVRASANLKKEDLKEAEEDLKILRAKSVPPAKMEQIEAKTKVLEAKKAEKAAIIKATSVKIKNNRNTLNALNDRAAAYESLGMHEQAIKDANRAMTLNKRNPKAYEILFNAYSNQKDTVKAMRIIEQAENRSVPIKPRYNQRKNQLLRRN